VWPFKNTGHLVVDQERLRNVIREELITVVQKLQDHLTHTIMQLNLI